ncbi:hypothetical protein [Fluoribacter gormanii]|uniref:Uncharacterized protein n=1 Tax=Fluoribacter gormanii TaxID=464 RepID=A0A377GGZ4_9GAMM|nr:hypothetical protein [Fluoribacter gormanii]KTD02445.1 hypothetical protein Lgor_1737 [Fluoribacter gormanii]SIR68939.1 hypothetical protein SAMN05421777_11945 [Fluoribacter gormanii]STO23652.1 Uncharacterised protein [Fluoribacter gormanii]
MNKAVDKLESVKEAFEHWRKTRTSQGKIPDYLWEQVKVLLGTYPLSKICSTLKISHVQIKENISEVSNEFQFVEVHSPAVSADLSSEFDTVILCSTSAPGIQQARLMQPITKGFMSSGRFEAPTSSVILSISS